MQENFTDYQNINNDSNFTLSFAVNEAGIVDVQMDWPTYPVCEEMLENIASLLFSIDSGQMRGLMIEAITNCSDDKELAHYVKSVVSKWLYFENVERPRALIRPRDTLQ